MVHEFDLHDLILSTETGAIAGSLSLRGEGKGEGEKPSLQRNSLSLRGEGETIFAMQAPSP